MCELRRLNNDNFTEMKNFFKEVFTKDPWNDDWSDDEQLSAYIRDIAGCFNSICYGFFDNGEMVGLSIGNKRHWWGGTEYVIEEFCIKKQEQGKGLGRKFLSAIEEDIVKNGMTQIFLQTERNVPAYEFYKKAGFTELESHVSFFKDNSK